LYIPTHSNTTYDRDRAKQSGITSTNQYATQNILLLPSLGCLRRLRFDCVELRHFLRIAFPTYATNNSIELDNGESMKNGGGGGHGGAGGGHSVVVEFGMMLLALCLPWPSLERKSAWLSS
jgi:hypothetical protein